MAEVAGEPIPAIGAEVEASNGIEADVERFIAGVGDIKVLEGGRT